MCSCLPHRVWIALLLEGTPSLLNQVYNLASCFVSIHFNTLLSATPRFSKFSDKITVFISELPILLLFLLSTLSYLISPFFTVKWRAYIWSYTILSVILPFRSSECSLHWPSRRHFLKFTHIHLPAYIYLYIWFYTLVCLIIFLNWFCRSLLSSKETMRHAFKMYNLIRHHDHSSYKWYINFFMCTSQRTQLQLEGRTYNVFWGN
jgi:hypothetical protein